MIQLQIIFKIFDIVCTKVAQIEYAICSTTLFLDKNSGHRDFIHDKMQMLFTTLIVTAKFNDDRDDVE